ncbi:MAG TPA: DUF192 domain-containing protein [Nitrososphaerales archaeon]|nr:DUF192 domain-containing protein [Nitrososphaerales archaeon]
MVQASRLMVIAVVAGIALIGVYSVYVATSSPGPVTTAVPSSFMVNGRTYSFTYTATNQAQWQEGLMNKAVTNTTTMLFAFPYFSPWQFWMFDTPTSLDMIWLNATGSSGRVVYLVASAPPCLASDSNTCARYTPTAQANYVIEAKSGFAAANNIVVGSTIRFGWNNSTN